MFKSAATKIAHNTTIPALAGNPDLRSLQELITAEKAVIVSLQKLSADFSKASEALKTWGLGEGDDLGNILGASTTILTHFTSAISQYASHGHTMREQLKAVRTREENLDELRRRRRNVASKADSAEKKLQKMGPEHKNLTQQTEQLNRLREEIRGLDTDIMRQEAAIGDFKRSATRAWLGLKFGGLLEWCEKGVIVGEYGKLIVSEIPEDETQPGLPRAQYLGHAKIDELVAEAHRCANEVRLSTVPAGQSRRVDQQLPQVPGVSEPFVDAHQAGFSSFAGPGSAGQPPFESHTDTSRRDFLPEPQSLGLGTGRFLDSSNEPQHQPQYSGSLSSASAFQSNPAFGTTGVRRVDEFGSTQPEGHIHDSSTPTGAGRFATFPVKGRSGSMGTADNIGSSSGVGVGVGSGGYPPRSDEKNQFSLISSPPQRQDSDSFSSSVAKALAASTEQPSRDEGSPPSATLAPAVNVGRFSKDGPAPAYESPVENVNPWIASTTSRSVDESQSSPTHARNISNLSNFSQGEGGLAYMSPSGGDVDDKHVSRHVRFGEVSQINDSPLPPMTPQDSATPSPMPEGPSMAQQQQAQEQGQGQAGPNSFGGGRGVTRVPVPSVNREDQERALDAAAAREIALELHSSPSPHEPQPQAPAMQRDLSAGAMSPLAPPTASYMSSDRKSVSPRPEYDYDYDNASDLSRAPTYTEHPTISVRQYDPNNSATPTAPLSSPPSQYGTPLSYPSQQSSSQQVQDPYANRRSTYEQEYNPYEGGPTQPRSQAISGNNSGGGGYGTKSQPPPPLSFDAQPPNAPYMRSATGARGSNSSLTGNLPSPGGASGKISAAAFKRPSPRPGPGPGVFGPPSPTVNLRGSNNNSPTQHLTSGGGGGGGMAEEARLPSPYGEDGHHQPAGVGVHPQSPYGPGHVHGQAQLDYGYDDDAPEGYYAEQHSRAMGANVNANANAGGGWPGIGSGGGGQGPPFSGGRGQGQQGGYGQGRFATNLEDGPP